MPLNRFLNAVYYWAMQRLSEETSLEQWNLDLNAPLFVREKQKVSRKVLEEELALFKRAKAVLSPGG